MDYILGNVYIVKELGNKKLVNYGREFKGKLIQHNKRLLVLKNNIGVRECFLKMDFITGDYNILSL